MASNDDTPPHGKTRLIQKFTAADFGPLNVYRVSECDNFRGGSYRLTTPVDNSLILHRLYGGTAQEAGQYWTIEPREGNVGFQMDYAVVPKWGSTLSQVVKLHVPPGIMLYEGYAGPQAPQSMNAKWNFGGGGWQVLIPLPVVQPLLQAQQAMMESKPQSEVEKHLHEAMSAQSSLLKEYEKEVQKRSEETLKTFCTMENAQHFLKCGNALQNLPAYVRSVLESNSSTVSRTGDASSADPTGSHLVHRQEVHLPNGKTATVSLNARLEFSHETRETTQSGKTITTVITRHYKCILEWV